ncbi:hypothetical protein NV226_01735 [Mycoplasma iguanae]|uniref:Uncharacterized protein n=1 Tax=Mycoplasma iguanae TaxID=292461 RepID=A0ABY5R8E6_9MOLU|nr:hypothetical protein [Mycoplasma iguanae]UVD81437.1 hypothetical protein NV226_01735 [Mycoplasma iguanae]
MEISYNQSFTTIMQKVHQFLNYSFYGGTDLTNPLETVLRKTTADENFTYSDIIIISDFLFKLPELNSDLEEKYRLFKQHKNRIIGLEINSNNFKKKTITKFLDEHYVYFYNFDRRYDREKVLDAFKNNFSRETYNLSEHENLDKISFAGILRKM